MKHKFILDDEELKTLDYAVTQTMYRIEASIDTQKLLNPDKTELIEALDELLLDLECVHGHLFEQGGDDL